VTVGVIRVVVHPERCAGSGLCRELAPSVFGADQDGWVALLDAEPDGDPDDLIDAYEGCPVGAIVLLNADGNRISDASF
jgi:ferredoxin